MEYTEKLALKISKLPKEEIETYIELATDILQWGSGILSFL